MVMLAGLSQEGHLEILLIVLGEFGDRIIHGCDFLSLHPLGLKACGVSGLLAIKPVLDLLACLELTVSYLTREGGRLQKDYGEVRR